MGVNLRSRRLAIIELARSDNVLSRLLADNGHQIIYANVENGDRVEPSIDVDYVKPTELANTLKAMGISRLYEYQYKAYVSITEGRNTIVTSGTGTGKTEAFLIPIMARALNHRREVVVYPTKALARDQESRFRSLAEPLGLRVATYDADSPMEVRRGVYNGEYSLVLTNPDMLNTAMLHVPAFRRFMSTVDYVTIDEIHVYNGVLGSHMHYLIRRIKNLNPGVKFAAASATIGNPMQYFSNLINSEVVHIEGIRGVRGELVHVMLRPIRRGKLQEVTNLVKLCVELSRKCIVFADSHWMVEVIKRMVNAMGIGSKVAVHRAGLRPDERRRVEDSFKSGELQVVLATPTLELGIDIGDADFAVMATNPPSFIKYLQRAGRVGRRGQRAYVIQVLGDDPMSTYYANHPEEFYNRSPEPMFMEPNNDEVAVRHLLAMVKETAVKLSKLDDYLRGLIVKLVNEGLVSIRGDRVFLTVDGLRTVNSFNVIRGNGDVVVIRRKGGGLVGYREMPMAIRELYPGAIYMHGGSTYKVLELDVKHRRAVVVPEDSGELITKALYNSNPTVVSVIEESRYKGIPIRYAILDIEEEVYGYVVKRMSSNETLGEYRLSEPIRYRFRTKGILLNMPPVNFSSVELRNFMEKGKAYHATEHVLISAGEVIVNAAPTDMGGVSYPTGHIVIYDSYPGGSGVTKLLMERIDKVIDVAYSIVTSCNCRDGCPRCVYSPYCGNNNRMLSRLNSIKVLEAVLKGEGGIDEPPPFEGSIP
ncbi:DEAD/DEAH box helicase [Caldivirga sp.]|uniref:DEAD/DEAH box helicase n=1 Tax=Caldivirga sp. TaxID=2080243 RepID=UPI003D0ADE22